MNIVTDAVYLTDNKAVAVMSSPQSVSADSGYDGFTSITATIESVDVSKVILYVGDYTNDVVTVTAGSKDGYYKRIYGE